MFVKSKFNIDEEKFNIRHKGKYIAEIKELEKFLDGDYKNMCLEYLTKREALNAGVVIRRYIHQMRKEKTLSACQKDNFVIVFKADIKNED
jgi:hypothetical protein